jgi:hypothetical protein
LQSTDDGGFQFDAFGMPGESVETAAGDQWSPSTATTQRIVRVSVVSGVLGSLLTRQVTSEISILLPFDRT